MTQRPNGRGPLPAKDVVNLGDLLQLLQWVSQFKPAATAGLLHTLSHKCAPISAPSITACAPDASGDHGSKQQTAHPVAAAQPLLAMHSAHQQLH